MQNIVANKLQQQQQQKKFVYSIQNVLFETSQISGAATVRLLLDGVRQFSLFPGQVIGVEGVNNTGRDAFHANEIIFPSIPDNDASSISTLHKYNYSKECLDGAPLNIVHAAGPFTVLENLLFEPFLALLKQLSQNEPKIDVLILVCD